MENKENLKIMSRTIEEIQKYFDERPELWAKIDEELAKDMSKGKGMSICEWGERLKKRTPEEFAYGWIIASIINACAIKENDEWMKMEVAEFKKWVNHEWSEEHVIGYKGFNDDMTCRGFQYEIGKEYEHDGEVWICDSGFHACKDPLAVLRYYGEEGNRYCIVEQWGYMDERLDKRVSSNIKIVREISLKELFEIAAEKMEKTMPQPAADVEEHEEEYENEENEPVKPTVYDGKFKDVTLSTSSYVGNDSNIILREYTNHVAVVTGDGNLIGVVGNNGRRNIIGWHNKIYVFGHRHGVNVKGCCNTINAPEGESHIVVNGGDCKVYAGRNADIVCMGFRNEVRAGIGSTITFVGSNGKIVSAVIDGKENTEDDLFAMDWEKLKDYE